MEFDDTSMLSTSTGADLHLLHRAPGGGARAVVQINHGLAEHAGRYARFADFLAGRGFHAYAHDHRGHGRTKAPGAPLGHFGHQAGADTLLSDVSAVHDHIAARHPGLPVIVFGHSMGGMIALNFALRHSGRIAGTAVWNAPLATRLEALAGKAVLAWERFRLGSDVPSRLLPKLTFGAWARAVAGHRTAFDWLSRDPAEVDKYVADPLCGFDASVGMWTALFDLSLMAVDAAAHRAARKDLPFHLVGGGCDPSTRRGSIVLDLEKRLRRNGFSNLETRIYEENRHESLNEINRGEVMRDFAAWAEKIID